MPVPWDFDADFGEKNFMQYFRGMQKWFTIKSGKKQVPLGKGV